MEVTRESARQTSRWPLTGDIAFSLSSTRREKQENTHDEGSLLMKYNLTQRRNHW